ncbi:hypothetical protein [Bacillus cytotoxicus]|uniref:hypothetical protein n=1 Tax=Bacillus cytotoxicus TaxID=580165 RepID=UPI000B355F8F|nr:hypothetical protein [Bacillus cytotoxicus]AWC29307.1 hypothetical protein CG483_013865 [Bacillus cytotoxicus]AWC41433.1 hypothetical protein CG480_013865 [Bacillus cytotoxicus]AWC49364.1 hypothetical protein CG478_013865 [Bacillus cytotoxicus]AWC53379.1 hypothetical protein CG477_013825 [Bacillus cytotoxicus]AWC57506.1 hypothetical protein CG476_013850 [Bacillus cytotoxicus]
MMEEYVLELYNMLYTTDWQDVISFLGILFCMKMVLLYMEEHRMFYSFSSLSDLQQEPIFKNIHMYNQELPFILFFMIRFITAVVKKKESEEEDCDDPPCHIAYAL